MSGWGSVEVEPWSEGAAFELSASSRARAAALSFASFARSRMRPFLLMPANIMNIIDVIDGSDGLTPLPVQRCLAIVPLQVNRKTVREFEPSSAYRTPVQLFPCIYARYSSEKGQLS